MPSLTTLLLTDTIDKAEEKDEKDGGVEKPPPIGEKPEKPLKPTKEQVAADKAGSKARDLKHRAREASYNALELDNSRKAHAQAAEAHRAAAKANSEAKDQASDPGAKQEFRNNEHEHNLHAAYHDKMSHSSEEDRKASAKAREPMKRGK